MNNPLMQFAMAMINKNPAIQNNPQAQEYINIIQNNDSAKGEQIATNLCNTYGVTKEQAIAQAKKYFGLS